MAETIESNTDTRVQGTTRSVCPECLALLDAQIVIKNGRVIMQKECPVHGKFEALLSSDAEIYLNSLPFNKPGKAPLSYSTKVVDGAIQGMIYELTTNASANIIIRTGVDKSPQHPSGSPEHMYIIVKDHQFQDIGLGEIKKPRPTAEVVFDSKDTFDAAMADNDAFGQAFRDRKITVNSTLFVDALMGKIAVWASQFLIPKSTP